MMSSLQAAKLALMDATHLGKDALHVHIGLLAFFAAALLLRWPLASGRPWLAAVSVACAGEAWDIADTLAAGMPLVLGDNGHDLWNTLLWPTMLTFLARAGLPRARA